GSPRFPTRGGDPEPPVPEHAAVLLRQPYVASGRATAVETWREAFAAHGDFEPLRDETFASGLDVDADRLLEMYETTSSIASLPARARTDLLAEVRPLLADRYRLPIRV